MKMRKLLVDGATLAIGLTRVFKNKVINAKPLDAVPISAVTLAVPATT